MKFNFSVRLNGDGARIGDVRFGITRFERVEGTHVKLDIALVGIQNIGSTRNPVPCAVFRVDGYGSYFEVK